jgi:hypothetical protein
MTELKKEFLHFLQDVNLLLTMKAGVSYAAVMRSIHPDLEAPRTALDNGVTPLDFVERVIEAENFMPVGDDVTPDEAGSHNVAIAAIAGFAFANRGEWHRTLDGAYYSEVGDDQTIFLRPVFSHKLNAYAIGSEIREGAALNAERTSFEVFGTVTGRYPGPDIGQAVDKALDHVEFNNSYSFSTSP